MPGGRGVAASACAPPGGSGPRGLAACARAVLSGLSGRERAPPLRIAYLRLRPPRKAHRPGGLEVPTRILQGFFYDSYKILTSL